MSSVAKLEMETTVKSLAAADWQAFRCAVRKLGPERLSELASHFGQHSTDDLLAVELQESGAINFVYCGQSKIVSARLMK